MLNNQLQNPPTLNQSIGVVIPIYNVAPYLRECLDSVINQTYKNLHV
ncbi:glycosyltransferase family A protein, partial [Helicobacter sp. 10-6591]